MYHAVGPFLSAKPFTLLEQIILKMGVNEPNFVQNTLVPIVGNDKIAAQPSLRMLDWAVTNYSKAKPVLLRQQNGHYIHVHNSYRSELKCFRRKCFDPFRRKQRIFVVNVEKLATADELKNTPWSKQVQSGANLAALFNSLPPNLQTVFRANMHETTVAQINFLRWANKVTLIDFCSKNKAKIEKHQDATLLLQRKRNATKTTPTQKSCTSKTKTKAGKISRVNGVVGAVCVNARCHPEAVTFDGGRHGRASKLKRRELSKPSPALVSVVSVRK